ncbi:MAG TPA: PrsW family glutamic-type intramembrane protease [Candidatus Limnocylindrales bacterium]|nr:PrsW family glutamic-type intramembrane protease [Candidatus Limnocylindrales bacterium]
MSTAAPPAPPPVAAAPPSLPRWGVQTGFFQRRQPAFWLFVVLFVFTALTIVSEQQAYLQFFPAGWLFSIVLLALYVVPVALAIWLLDLFEREPISLVAAAFVWGGIVAAGLAITTNTALLEALAKLFGPDFAQTWGVAVVAPPVEETFKYLGVVVIYLIARSEIDDLFDGFVYGAIVGLGFAAVENVTYFMQAVAGSGGGDQIGPVLGMFVLRSVLVGAYMHVLWTGLSGLGLAYYVTQRDQPRGKRVLYAAALFALAVGAHFIWNSPLLTDLLSGLGGIVVFGLIKGLPFLAFLVLLVVLARRRERRWFGTFTAADVGTDVLTEQELADLSGLRSRWDARRRIGQRKGPQVGRLAGQLQREQINLAMIRARVGDDQDPALYAQRDRIRAIRGQLDAFPDLVPAGAMTMQPGAPGVPSGMPTQPPGLPTQPPGLPIQPPGLPTHVVPPAGMAAWIAPDPTQPPSVMLGPGVPLALLETRGAWARVIGSNGWTGWVDGRLLVRLG